MDVLIVEDELLVSRSLVDLLEHHGHRARVADDAVEALQLLRGGHRPDVIVLDLILPQMSGRTFLEVKNADPALAEIPVVVFTGSAVRELPKGASSLLTKPTTEDGLLSALKKAIEDRAHRAA
jgi:CheY-like chemotaxis protein